MANREVYKKAIAQLFDATYGKFEHDDLTAIELFDKLIDKGIKSHCDTVRQLCEEVGYSKYACDEIAHIYDVLSLYKVYKKTNPGYWDIDRLLKL